MAFKINEIAFNIDGLLINIVSQKDVKIGDTTLNPIQWVWCLEHFFCHIHCTQLNCLPAHQPPEEISKAFSALKEQLDQHPIPTEEIKEKLLPQTVAQVDELQKKLHAVLVELDTRRGALEHRSA